MNGKAVSGIVLTLLLIGSLTLAFNIQPVKAEPKTWTVDDDGPADFSSIKEAIDSPQVVDGDTIYVYNGTYVGSVVVDKTVLLIGESKDALIHGYISIRAHNVTIRNFTIRGGNVVVGSFFEPAINATIRENTLVNGGISIQTRPVPSPIFGNHTIEENSLTNASIGICMLGSAGNKIIGNTLRDGGVGILLEQDADNNTVLDNQVEGCEVGIHMCSFNNTLSGNAMNDNIYNFGFYLYGAYPNTIDTSNTINGRPVYFVVNQSNILVDPVSYPSPGYLALINCENATVKDLILSGNGQGILLQGGERNTLRNNTLVDNAIGLHVISSDRNELTDNTISDNGMGMWLLRESSFNNITNNEFENNTRACLNKLPRGAGWICYSDLRYDFGWGAGALYLKFESSSNLVVGNTITNSDVGVFLAGCSNNTLRDNAMTNNIVNFGVYGYIDFSHFDHDIDDSNTVNGKPVIYWVNEQGKQIPENAGYVAIINCSDITIKNLEISNNMHGILSVSSRNSLILGNEITDCPSGIMIMQSYEEFPTGLYPSTNVTVYDNIVVGCGVGTLLHSGEGHIVSQNDFSDNMAGIFVKGVALNVISGNTITNCTYWSWDKLPHEFWSWFTPVYYVGSGVGICIETPFNIVVGNTIGYNEIGMTVGLSTWLGNNIIHHNNFINNTYYQVWTGSKNVWDAGYPLGGNYWSDQYHGDCADHYNGPSQDIPGSDGIVDTPYTIDGNNQDNYPLMEPWTPLPRTISELKTEIEELGSQGEIDNQGIVKSLIAKLNVAQKLIDKGKIDHAKNILNAFINEVQAQSGKHITPEAAEILIKSVEHIISHL